MKKGDLIKPLSSCGGEPGAKRCNVALVLEPVSSADSYKAKIMCPCGVGEVYRTQIMAIESSDLAYSADPM